MPDLRNRAVAARVFAWAWPLAILLLPWQARWFLDASWAGWPWEMGRFSIYVSWFPMVAAIVTGWRSAEKHSSASRASIAFAVSFLFLTLFATGGEPAPLRAWAVWWVQVAMPAAFAGAVACRVPHERLAAWFVVSLWPQAVLAFFQAVTNAVAGSKWIGVASQEAARSGVAVVDAGGRFLRAYGGFPHPNILGAWMAFGTIAALDGALRAKSRDDEGWKLWALSSAAFSVAVAFSVSRAAWIGLCLGIVGWMALRLRDAGMRRAFLVAAVPLLAFGIAVVSRPALVRARAAAQGRLEARSVGERVDSYRTALRLWRERPFVGTGLNADVLRAVPDQPSSAPPQPIHALPLLWLAQLGLLGCAFLTAIVWKMVRALDMRTAVPLGLALLPSALFDHFLWTLWAGQALVAMEWLAGTRLVGASSRGCAPGMIEIRELDAAAIPRVYALAKQIFGADVEDEKHGEAAWKAHYAQGGLLLGAFDGDRLVGFKFGYRREAAALHSWLGGVDGAYRNQGIAGRLMEAQERIAKAHGDRSITVSTVRGRFAAMHALLLANGYRISKEEPRADGDVKVFFVKDL